MAGIWDKLFSDQDYRTTAPAGGYADLYQSGLLARNRDQAPLSVRGAQATQDFMPVIGDLVALGEAGDAFSRGELAAAGLLGAGAAIGLVPGAGDALAKPVMAVGRRAADIARRIEVDPNALGSMGGNIRLRADTPPSPAQEVAGLLSSGRANEVTDEMLAKFTPNDEKEMFDLYQRGATGMDLPMDEASRMARAQGMGFDTPAYHGTQSDFVSASGDFYTTPDTNYANIYSGSEYDSGGRVLPLMQREGGVLDTRKPDGASVFDDSFYMKYGNASPLTEKGVPDWVEGPDFGEMFQDQGLNYSGVFLDEGKVPLSDGQLLDRGVSTLHFDPTNIRSRFARFDPRLAHLRNLSAGVGGLGLLSSMMPPEEQY